MAPSALESAARALEALSLMRRDGLSFDEAVARAGTTRAAMRRYAGAGLRRVGETYVVTARDDIPRSMTYLDPIAGPRWVTVRDSEDASRLGAYHNDVRRFLATGDEALIRRWEGASIATDEGSLPLLTNVDELELLALGGELEYELYRRGR